MTKLLFVPIANQTISTVLGQFKKWKLSSKKLKVLTYLWFEH